jgi:hypothetical protein
MFADGGRQPFGSRSRQACRNARTRAAAAVSLLRALQRQQVQERKKAARDPAPTHAPLEKLSEFLLQHNAGEAVESPD